MEDADALMKKVTGLGEAVSGVVAAAVGLYIALRLLKKSVQAMRDSNQA